MPGQKNSKEMPLTDAKHTPQAYKLTSDDVGRVIEVMSEHGVPINVKVAAYMEQSGRRLFLYEPVGVFNRAEHYKKLGEIVKGFMRG